MKFKIFRISGSSMEPEFRSGDFVLISRLTSRIDSLQPGTAIAFLHPQHGMLIKKVQYYNPTTKIFLARGTVARSLSADAIGPIPLENVFGKVIGHVRKKNPSL